MPISSKAHRRRLLTAAMTGVLAGTALTGLTGQPAAAVGPTPHYLMTAFTNSSESNTSTGPSCATSPSG